MGAGAAGAGRWSRLLGEREAWTRWGLPMGRVAGVRVRLHWVFVVYIAVTAVFTLPHHHLGIEFRLPLLGASLVLVLLHEFGHVVACRRVGGEADEIVAWPLGGLAPPRPPRDWRPELWTALGGPIVNAALLLPLTAAVYLATRSWALAVPNPFDVPGAMATLTTPAGTTPWWLIGLWSLHATNLVLLLANTCLPMHPLDGGRLLQCLLWARAGYHRSVWLAAHTGLVAGLLLVAGGVLFSDGQSLILVGLVGLAVCWGERRRVQFLAGDDPELDRPTPPETPEPEDPERGDPAEVDQILEKISKVGMEGLSRRERGVLKRATERSRETEGRGGESDE